VSLFGPRGEATDPAPQDEEFLLKRPAPAWSEFAGAEIIDKGAICDGGRSTARSDWSIPFHLPITRPAASSVH
jgi:hypothetical protein